MKQFAVTFTAETEIEDEAAFARVLQAALDNMTTASYFDYSDLTVEVEGKTAIARPEHDFALLDTRTILVLVAQTDEARAWIEKNVSKEGYNPDLPNRAYVDPRFRAAILNGIIGAGLTIDASESEEHDDGHPR